jgi:hypothetical protein
MSNLNARSVTGKDGQPVLFPTGIMIGNGAPGTTNNIGIAGQAGFGVGICPGPLPSGMGQLPGCTDPLSDNYGNYQYSDGSVMVWIPAFFYKVGTGANGLTLNKVDVKPFSAYVDVSTANAAGYALHRAFYDGGAIQLGVFVDKYLVSNNNGIASSIKNGVVLTSGQRGSLSTAVYSALTGAPANTLGGSIAAAKTRGSNFFANSRFIFAALATLSMAHGQAATASTYCAWYDVNGVKNFPKGCNNNANGDAQDSAILFQDDGNGTYACGKTGSANLFSRTTHNGQNCGIADLNGVVWEYTPGLGSDGTNYYALKTSKAMKNMTGGNTLATDLFGATGLSTNYDSLGASYAALTAAAAWKYFGSATQVFSEATSGNAWNVTGLGIPLAGGVGGTNAFGNDGLYDARTNEMAPISGGGWGGSSGAGVWALALGTSRSASSYDLGFRSALYL